MLFIIVLWIYIINYNAFELVLQSAWELSSPGKQVARSSTPCQKRSQVWGTESERWPKYMSRDASVGNKKNFEKQAQSSKG